MRSLAAWNLGDIGGPAVQPLVSALKVKDTEIRRLAASALTLGDFTKEKPVEPLFAAIKDRGSVVRSLAATALGDLGDARAVEPLIATLEFRHRIPRIPGEFRGRIPGT